MLALKRASLLTSRRALSALRPIEGGAVPGLVGGPVGAPAVVVIQEWWGLTDLIKSHAEAVVAQGYRVAVPDIYKGAVGVDAEEASHLMGNLDFPGAVAEIGELSATLRAEGSPKVGVVGFCMGGALTLGAASKAPFDAAAPFYGVNFDLLDAAALKDTPVQGHFGKLDEMVGFSDPTAAAQLEAVLKAAGNDAVECHLYDGVGHAFMNASPAPFATFDAREEALGFPAHDPTAAETAWTRLFAFLGEHLK